MADVHFTRMHCDRKSFQKANRRLLKDKLIRDDIIFFVLLNFQCLYPFFLVSFSVTFV